MPSCAATISGPLVAADSSRAWSRIASMSWSECVGQWWNSASVRTPASLATCTAYSIVEWPKWRLTSYSDFVCCASWIRTSTPSQSSRTSFGM